MMEKQFIRLCKHFNYSPSAEFAAEWQKKMKKFDLSVITEAVQHLIENRQPNINKFPTITEVWIIVDSINHNRQKEIEKKQDEISINNICNADSCSKVGLDYLKLINDLIPGQNEIHGKITKREFAERLRKLEKRDTGKTIEADMFVKNNELRGDSLSEKVKRNQFSIF